RFDMGEPQVLRRKAAAAPPRGGASYRIGRDRASSRPRGARPPARAISRQRPSGCGGKSMFRLDDKLARIHTGAYRRSDFIIADAKDPDMGPGLHAVGPGPGEARFKTRAE